MFKKLCNFIFCIFIFTQTSFCFANSQKLSCAVISNNLVGKQSDRDFSSIKYSVDQILSQRKDLKIIDRSKVDKILQEQAFQQSDWSDSNKSAEIGHALNANILIFVEYYRDFFVVNFLDVNTFEKTTVKSDLDEKNIYTRIKNVKINNHSIMYNFVYWTSCHRIFSICILVICGVFTFCGVGTIFSICFGHRAGIKNFEYGYFDENDIREYETEFEKEWYGKYTEYRTFLSSFIYYYLRKKFEFVTLIQLFTLIAIVSSLIIILLNNLSYSLFFLMSLSILMAILIIPIMLRLGIAIVNHKIPLPYFLSPDAFINELRKRKKRDRRVTYQRKKSTEEISKN